ncbi:Clathrin adaptor complex small chain [Babesia microti strain RI]|uniref:AP complex subunit sigma n=1 Tax=Babesia microti (strain RI) TaxID=1133968 RepID=A0A0K3AUQ3_BABMR|nr:Clathrin adaptor complex small chain [Babesia microti strain RI]CTQ41326.1 Clathrin adaptor complex small chain [Babesia microti strain RI]|eukprot:XP_012649337.1 Clathrin adaptor complex small chain [Babesia microti strain RI]
MIKFFLMISRRGKVRLAKWFTPISHPEKVKTIKQITSLVLNRNPYQCNFIQWEDYKLIYKRYASLFFISCAEQDDNELLVLEIMHHYVEILDRYFGNVCELDIIYNYQKAYYMIDEILIGGDIHESSKKTVLRIIAAQDAMMEESKGKSAISPVK